MQTKFDELKISKEEYNFFLTLSAQEQLDYFYDLYAASTTALVGIDLGKYFKSLHDDLEADTEYTELDLIELPANSDRVDVLIDDDTLMIETNSLKALRHVASKFMESGFILRRDRKTEKMFHKDKITRYLRVFYIIDQITGICLN
jgi:hypothetical protein